MKRIFLNIFLILSIFIVIFSLSAGEGIVDKSKPLLKVTFIDVGQGDAMLIEPPTGEKILIDAGTGNSEYSRIDCGRDIIIPYLKKHGINKIDYLIISHPHADHHGGVPYLIKNFKIGKILESEKFATSETYEYILQLVGDDRIDYDIIKRKSDNEPAELKFDKMVKYFVLSPPPKLSQKTTINNSSVVIKLIYKKVSFLFTGDAEAPAEDSIAHNRRLKGYLSSTIYKAPHHGSDTSSSWDFLKAVNPEVVVISVGRNNKFGHPAEETLQKFRKMNLKILRTDYNGNIVITTDGENYQIVTEK